MNEDILIVIVPGDKAIPTLYVEPLYFAGNLASN